MTTPSIFILSVGCIINNWLSGWLCSSLGVTPYVWVAGVMPSFVVYNMCDRRELKRAAGDLGRVTFRLGTVAKVLSVGSIVLACSFQYVPWIFLAMAGFAYFVSMAFSHEKTMYMGDKCGAIAKEGFQWVISNFVCELARMKMKGDWNFCSPYSRTLELISTDHYYTLKRTEENCQPIQTEDAFISDFGIERCRVVCKHEIINDYPNGIEQKMHTNKVEVSLLYGEEALEEYTYLHIPFERVAQIRHLLEILQRQGNLVFSTFHRNVGSEFKLAHASCYEFDEMLELVLRKGWTLKRINLDAKYDCSISGSSFPHGSAASLLLGLAACLISGVLKLGPEMSAAFFAVAILPAELDIFGLYNKARQGVRTLLSPFLSAELLKSFRVKNIFY